MLHNAQKNLEVNVFFDKGMVEVICIFIVNVVVDVCVEVEKNLSNFGTRENFGMENS